MKEIERNLRERIGLDAASIGSSQIHRSVRLRMKSHGLKRAEDYKDLLRCSAKEWDELVEAVVVSETWFFRDQEAFGAFVRLVTELWMPRNPAGRARLLSLPCSSGEEPYSLAMALLDAGLAPERFEIDGIDISGRVLVRAQKATYGKNSFRGTDLRFRDRHFQWTREGFVLNPAIRACVRFSQGNILAENFRPPATAYDFIFCRNLLIYFDRPTQHKALTTIGSLLAAEGMLFVGAAELPLVIEHGYVSAQIPMAFACRKAGAKDLHPRPVLPALKPVKVTLLAPPPAAINGQPQSHPRPHAPAAVTPLVSGKGGTDLEAARLLADAGQLQEAAKICEAHLHQNGPSVQAFYLLGLVRDAAGDPRAEDFYRKALYLEPNHYDTLLQLALWFEKNGEVGRARSLKSRAERLKLKT